MPKIHPRVAPHYDSAASVIAERQLDEAYPSTLTVWKKSLMFNCNGFTVYDSFGNLVFRVDNYASHRMSQVVLMDGAGNALLTMRRKRFSLWNGWQGFSGEKVKDQKPMLYIRRTPLLQKKSLGNVLVTSSGHSELHIKGSFAKRSCTIYNKSGAIVAEVKRKQATSEVMLGDDVFSLVVQPGYDQAFVMGLVVTLESLLRPIKIFWK
eukprot:Gb_03357 [translate_table: standard]